MYKLYEAFCKKWGFTNEKTFQPNINKFNNRIVELDFGLKRVRTSETQIWRFTMKEVYESMLFKQWIISAESDKKIDIEDEANIGGDDFDDYFNMA